MTNSRYIQELTLYTDKWKVDLNYENWNLETKTIEKNESDFVIELSEKGEWDSTLKFELIDEKTKRTCIVTGIQGGTFLHKKENDENSQSVKIDNDSLLLSLGLNFISIDLNDLRLNWRLEPDVAEVFEFYDLENDYLLRGELEIHRIDKKGQIKWSYGGRDIWVNLDGNPEVQIEENTVRLLDFNSNEYLIDFNGNTLEDKPLVTKKRKWWALKK